MFFRSFSLCVAMFLASACGMPQEKLVSQPVNGGDAKPAAPAANVSACSKGTMRVLVLPFENDANANSLSAFSLGIAAHVSEALEADPCVTPVNDERLVLTEEQARLLSPKGSMPEDVDRWFVDVMRLAAKSGATHVLTGKYSGAVEDWEVEATLVVVPKTCTVDSCVSHAETGYANGSLVEDVTHPNGKAGQLQSAAKFYAMLGEAVSEAFSNAATLDDADMGAVALAATTVNALSSSQAKGSKETYAPLLLARAYVRYFHIDLPRKRMFEAQKAWKKRAAMIKVWRKEKSNSALGLAAAAVNNDPTFVQAQRFYAMLAETSVALKNPTFSARIHYEAALASGPTDFRSLMALGSLEMDDKHSEVARGYFSRASKVRPNDAEPLHRLGQACLAYGQTTNAMQAFENARTVNPARSDSRRELAVLYAKAKRYTDAAAEYDAVVKNDPDDVEAHFALAASLRAAGDIEGAIYAYGELEIPRVKYISKKRQAAAFKFHADLRATSSVEGAQSLAESFYQAAASIDPSDKRPQAILSGVDEVPLGGKALRDAIDEASDIRTQLENRRSRYQVAINDAVADLRLNGEEACKDGQGASSALLAISEGKKHSVLLTRLNAVTGSVQTALNAGEGLALTPDEQMRATETHGTRKTSVKDARTMRAQYIRGFLPLYNRHKCGSYDGEITEATFEAVIARNDVRTIEPPEVPRRQGAPMFFSPEIDSVMARNVSITIDNRDGPTDYAVSMADPDDAANEVEWQPLGIVVAGTVGDDLHVRTGLYRVCVVPKGTACGTEDLERVAYLHDGWAMRILADE